MEQVEWWWNGKWGRLARRDVWLRRDGTSWRIEAQQGGRDGRRLWWRAYPDEAAARTELAAIMARASDKWTDMANIRRPREVTE